jgi:hypothetical protein
MGTFLKMVSYRHVEFVWNALSLQQMNFVKRHGITQVTVNVSNICLLPMKTAVSPLFCACLAFGRLIVHPFIVI